MRRVDLIAALRTEYHLISAALGLNAEKVPGLSAEERMLTRNVAMPPREIIEQLRREIARRRDPLGDAFTNIRAAGQRRERGATYTPHAIVNAMVKWAKKAGNARAVDPQRVIDPGVGSGRFLVAAGREFPNAELIGIDIDPLAALMARAHLAAAGCAERAQILVGDYRELLLPAADGSTLYIGNPPYVRHHRLDARWKQWLTTEANKLGFKASQLAGLHVHFFIATVLQAKAGDMGSFITAAEWLDVNYGRLVRELFLNDLGGQSVTILEPAAKPFADAATTAVISTFEIGSKPKSIRVKRIQHVHELEPLATGRLLHRSRLEMQPRWSRLTRRIQAVPSGYVELGELCRVHRGQVTGANRVWIAGEHSRELPTSVLFRSVTKARELFAAGDTLADDSMLRDVIDLPIDLSAFDKAERQTIEQFLKYAKKAGAADGYVAENRHVWWSVGLKAPAPILATYMARRPPAFVRNLVAARHINIAHGLYPRDPLPAAALDRLATYLSDTTTIRGGRTYAGGLTKFEPREMERLLVPGLEALIQAS
ncbi:MAG: Eco57I restriction-modification methylase domain-containing protein [Bryobacteraceae bacterium]